ncbi:MAG TPA: T9SS type A sorting domain-containing protein [Bacteroidales bacterium]|nr:T9SS type A sorting domain-containing protein [Bacteroidales bacterium]
MKTRTFTLIVAFLSISMLSKGQFLEPVGGWDYIYNGDVADTTEEAALDGTYEASSSSFEWDGTAPQSTVGAPGGAGIITEGDDTFLRIQDTGDPRTLEQINPVNGRSNRKIGFIHCVANSGLDSSAAILDDGFTIAFRAKIPTTGVDNLFGDEEVPYPENGDGYEIDGSGYAPIVVSQWVEDVKKTIGFTLMTEFDDDTISSFGGAGLYMNLLNGASPAKEVGMPQHLSETTTVNKINLDVTVWHDFWIQITPGGTGTHQVKIWVDGDVSSPETFDVTAGRQSFRDWSYVWMAFKNTSETGAIDIDYLAYKSGLAEPTAASVKNHDGLDKALTIYPNPFNAMASLKFNLEESGLATVKAYNAIGQVVKTFINEELPAGMHTRNISADGLSKGIYFLELTSGDQREIYRTVIK